MNTEVRRKRSMDFPEFDTLLGIPIGLASAKAAAEVAMTAVHGQRPQVVFACANSNSLNVSRKDREFREALIDAEQVVADGAGVKLIAKLAGKNVGTRIIGQHYFETVMAALEARGGGGVFFFGSSQAVLERIQKRFGSVYPHCELAGALSPPFGDWSEDDNEHYISTINDAKPDVLWVGMTAPKQEKWVYRNRHDLHVPVIGSIGAVFDFFAGTFQNSPKWVRRAGLEAVYRLAQDPKRLWQRVLVSNVTFLVLGLWYEVFGFGRGRKW